MAKFKLILLEFTLVFSGIVINPASFAYKTAIVTESSAHGGNETSTTTSPAKNKENIGMPEVSLLPKPPVCGPLTVGNKIFGGEETELGEFPWLVPLEHKTRVGNLITVCAGNIINQRYILTAAHCVVGNIELEAGKLVSARVGVHNLEGSRDCSSGCPHDFQRVQVEKAVVHPDYNPRNDYRNDIALLRTDKDMQYSIAVAPVCLPDVFPESSPLKTGLMLSVAGWGHTGLARFSEVKLKVDVPYVENAACSLEVVPEQLCAGGVFRKDSCSGDSGGGLIRLESNAYVMVGIVSYGHGCGKEQPAVYTRVSSYIPWIHANVKP